MWIRPVDNSVNARLEWASPTPMGILMVLGGLFLGGAGLLSSTDPAGMFLMLIAAKGGRIESLVSLPIGAVRLSERYLRADPPTSEEVRALYAALDDALAQPPLPLGVPLVGTAGTVTTLAAVALGLPEYVPERVQGMRIARGEVERQIARYLAVPLADRKRIPGLQPKRADTIVAGAAIVDRVMARARVEEIIVSDRGIRWGLAYELAGRAG